MVNQVNEAFELLPINLKIAGNIDGMNIYTNNKIQNYVRDWLTYSPITKKVAPKILEGIDKGVILLGYEDGSKRRFMKRQWRDFLVKNFDAKYNDNFDKNYVGYISTTEKKIAIVFDDNVNIRGRELIDVPHSLIHECLHLAALSSWKQFISTTMNPYLIPFYTNLFNNIEPKTKEIPARELSKAIINVSRISDHNFYNKPDMNKIYHAWTEYFKQHPDIDSTNLLMKCFSPYYKYSTNTLKNEYHKVAKQMVFKYSEAYRALGIKNVLELTVPCQEILFPSEIVCMTNEFKPSNIAVKLINSLRF